MKKRFITSGLGLQIGEDNYIEFSYFSTKAYAVSTQKNHLNEEGSFVYAKHICQHMRLRCLI